MTARETLDPTTGRMGSAPEAIGVGVGNEGPLENGFQEVAQRVVDDAVAERGRRDEASLRVVDQEVYVVFRTVTFPSQLFP